jgi:hypothetical protein
VADLPPYLICEEQFADWCRARELDEDDESWRSFCMWVDDGGDE